MNFEVIENWSVAHCPNIKMAKKLLNYIKWIHVNRYKIKQKDINAIETGNLDKAVVLKKYKQRWKKYEVKLEKQIFDYLEISGKSNEIALHILEDVIFCRYAYGFMPDEYFAYKLDQKSSKQRQEYISDRDRLSFIYKVNDILDMEIVRNKNLTFQHFKDFYKRDAVCINKKTNFTDFVNFVKIHPIFVQKNVKKNCGQGVKLIDFNKVTIPYETYFENLKKEDDFILEERIIQSKKMGELNKSSVNTVRCVTLVTDNGIIVDHCFLKVGRNNSFLDNGAAGGLLIGIELKNGKLNTDAINEFGEVFEKHPDSDIVFKGFQLPEWNSLMELSILLAKKCPSVRFVGWDLAHTDQGWVLVEGNGRSQVIGPQLIYEKGYKTHFEKVMNIQF